MKTIEEEIKNSKRLTDAKFELEKFDKMIELIKEYPTKFMKQPPIDPPYELN